MKRISFQFVPQAVDTYMEHVVLPQVLRTPDRLYQQVLRHNMPCMLPQVGDDAVLSRGEWHFPAAIVTLCWA